jgi:UDP-glucose 4-epimerase
VKNIFNVMSLNLVFVHKMNILVVGGAGYIGSHMVKRLLKDGHHVMVIDNLSKGYRDAVLCKAFFKVDMADRASITKIFAENPIDVVFHFASFIEVGESILYPEKYYKNNTEGTQALLEVMNEFQVNYFIFSSTAAVFGNPQYHPIDEKHPKNPINPYGHSKLLVEEMLERYARSYSLKSVVLRYFNAAGADPEGELGERHYPETHLIPLVLQAASGRRDSISVFGNDYDTFDGTCVRDYIHIHDLVEAHVMAMRYLKKENVSGAFNLGNGQGFSVLEIIKAAEAVTRKKIPVKLVKRRLGDPPTLVADASLAKKILGWSPQLKDIHTMIEHAWHWEQKFPW